jgi:hypothetical protein
MLITFSQAGIRRSVVVVAPNTTSVTIAIGARLKLMISLDSFAAHSVPLVIVVGVGSVGVSLGASRASASFKMRLRYSPPCEFFP